MMPHWVVDGLRGLQFLLAVWAMARLVLARIYKWKEKYTAKEKVSWTALFLITLLFIESPFENYFQSNGGGPRQVIGVLALIAIIWVTYSEDDRRIMINTYEQENEE